MAFARFIQGLGIREVLSRALPDGRTSNNQVGVVDMMLQFMATVLIGGRRFEHVERLRGDEVVRAALGASRFGSASSWTRYLANFLPSQTEHLQQTFVDFVLGLLGVSSDVLDLDSTVFLRHGEGTTRKKRSCAPINLCWPCWRNRKSSLTPGCVLVRRRRTGELRSSCES